MGELIPLFPLGTPLFPGVVLPLQIFEPRYRRLMRDLLRLPEGSDRRSFGVVAIRQGWEVEAVAPAEALYDVGCTALLRRVHPQADGGYRIVTVGGKRFRMLDVVVGGDVPYLRAEVEWLAEEEAAEEAAAPDDVAAAVARGSLDLLVGTVRDLFTRYVAAVSELRRAAEEEPPGEADPTTSAAIGELARDPAAFSCLVASAALLTVEDRQALLSESAVRRRLASEARLLRRELVLLETLGAVPAPLQRFTVPMTVN